MPSQRKSRDSLREIQRLVTTALFRPLGRGETMQRASAEIADRVIRPNDRLTSFERLQIYNQQYWWRLLGAFAEDFRGLRAVIGERKFDKLAVAYLHAHGSTSWNLRDLGQHLVAFLRDHPHLTAPHSALALEVAQIEWAAVEAFDGPSKAPLDPQKIARIAPEKLKLQLQPYLTLLQLAYPADKLLGRLKRRGAGASSNAVSASRSRRPLRLSAKPAPSPVFLAVHRVDYAVYYKRLEPEAFTILSALRNGTSIEDACESAFKDSSELPENAAAKVQSWFSTWMRLGWLCRG